MPVFIGMPSHYIPAVRYKIYTYTALDQIDPVELYPRMYVVESRYRYALVKMDLG
jgi:hypothetical protein